MKSVPKAPEGLSQGGLKSSLHPNTRKSEKIAGAITNFFGSLRFLIFCVLFFIFWITWNITSFYGHRKFDPYPFPALEMVVSVFAIILSVSVLINQKSQSYRERINQQVEFEVNVRAENEITQVLRMLHEIQARLGIANSSEDLEDMKKDLDLKEIHQKLENSESADQH